MNHQIQQFLRYMHSNNAFTMYTCAFVWEDIYLTLGAHAQRGLRWLSFSVCLSVCVSVPHLTSGASVRPEIEVTYSTANEGQNICDDFSETASLQRSSTSRIVLLYPSSATFRYAENMRMHMPRLLARGMAPRGYGVCTEGLHLSTFHYFCLFFACKATGNTKSYNAIDL